MRFLEILLGAILLPVMIVLGFILGIVKVYQIFDQSFWKTVRRRNEEKS